MTPQHNSAEFIAALFNLSDAIRQIAESLCAHPAAADGKPIEDAANGRVFVYEDSPEWPRYHAEYLKKHGKKPPRVPQFRGDTREGWRFPPMPATSN